MTPFAIALLCAAYIFGLLLTGFSDEVARVPIGAIASLILGTTFAAVIPRIRPTLPRSRWWLAAGLVACLAVFYFQFRTPQPIESDVSHWLGKVPTVQVQGEIDSPPRLTRSQKIQFWLKANQVKTSDRTESVTGKLYVTVPLLQGTGLYPGQSVTVSGFLYDPKPATNPGGFNFQAFLKQEGGFAGLSGRAIAAQTGNPPLLWSVRQRILRSQVEALSVPVGPLVSAMVMGRNGVDLPFPIQDQFSRAGLAHALAASGFQVSLLIGIVVSLTRRLPTQARWSLGTGIVLAYIGLTGIQPSVLRAGIMGLAALYALTIDRKIRPLSSLLVAATVLLLWNPLWIWNLGFQFSFMATLGLLVTAQPLTNRLDWLPTSIASTAAVSIAAYLWTLPLQLFVFGIVSPYSILINVLATPLIIVVSIGGMISAVAALINPAIGTFASLPLYYPTQVLLELVAWGDRLPGNTYAIGAATPLQVVTLYLMWAGLSWRFAQAEQKQRSQSAEGTVSRNSKKKLSRLLWATAALSISLVALPAWYARAHLTRISVLATEGMPVVVVQMPRQVVLINSGSETEVRYTVQPFLRQAGINHIDRAIALDDRSNWNRLHETHPIEMRYQVGEAIAAQPFRASQTLSLEPLTLRLISIAPTILDMQLGESHWLLMGKLEAGQQLPSDLPNADVLWWSGENLPALLNAVQPDVAIAPRIHPAAATTLRRQGATTFTTTEQGAIEWTPQRGFTSTLEAEPESPCAQDCQDA